MIGRRNITAVMMAILVALVSAGLAFAIPPVINYQGKLVDSVGDPVNTSVDITFTIYNAPTGGDVLWTETQNVSIVNGIFNVYLGAISTITDSTFNTDAVYLGIQVAGNAEMTPRQLYSAAPYAFRAHSADMVAEGAVTSAMIANGTILGEDIATDTITSAEIASGAVNSSEIADGAVGASEIGAGSIFEGHITSGAVTTDKILDGTITDADISASAAISASKIDPNGLDADTLDGTDSTGFAASVHQHSGGDITDGTITGNDIADDAVSSISILDGSITDADISSTANIAASKINRTGLDADKFDGLESTEFTRKYEKVAVVAISGGDYTSPVDAVDDLANWCGTPMVTGPCLIKVMPGIYDIGTSSVVLQPLLSIEGSGMYSTLINGTIDSSSSGVIIGAEISEIRHLMVQNYGTGAYAVAISHTGTGDSLRIYDVRAMTEGATNCFTIRSDGSASTEIHTVTASANCTGANKAIYSNGSDLRVVNTRVEVESASGNAYGIHLRNSAYSYVSNVHAYAYTSGILNAAGVYYESSTGELHNVVVEVRDGLAKGVMIESISDVMMKDVTAAVSSINLDDYVIGVSIKGSTVEMYDVVAEASGGLFPRGVQIEASSDVTMRNVTAKASTMGATSPNVSAIYTVSSTVDMEGISAEASTSDTSGNIYGITANVSTGGEVRMKGISVGATGGENCFGISANGVGGGYMPMTDVRAWCMNGANTNYGISAAIGDFGMKNVEAYGGGGSVVACGIYLDTAYASMQGVEALGTGNTSMNRGIQTTDAEIEGVDVEAQGEGGGTGNSYGLYMGSSIDKTVSIMGGKIKSHGGATGYGIYLSGYSSIELTGVNVQTSNGTEMMGIYGAGGTSGSSIRIDSSVIDIGSPFYTVFTTANYSTTIGSTRLRGVKPTTSGGSTFSCASSYHDMGGTVTDAYSDCQ